MTPMQPSNPSFVTLDASFVVAYCAKEPNRDVKAKAQIVQYANAGKQLYAPGTLVAEVLFAFCRKLAAGDLTPVEHTAALKSFETIMQVVLPPPHGEPALIARADQIRGSYSCSRSADGIYLALAEALAQHGLSELVTFDQGMVNQAAAAAPNVSVTLLT
jgi:predicted nucleic acid-binding protein